MPFCLYTYTKLTEREPEPYTEYSPDSPDSPGTIQEDYIYEEDEYSHKEYQERLQRLHSTLSSTVTFLSQLLHSFSNDIQNLTYVSERTINQLWTAKLSSFTVGVAMQDRSGTSSTGSPGGKCLWVRKIRAFLTQHHRVYDYTTNKKAKEYLREMETHLTQAISTAWPPRGTSYTPDSVVYSDLSLDTLYVRLLLLLEWFPVSTEYKRIKQLVVELELLQITMDRVWFLYSSQSV